MGLKELVKILEKLKIPIAYNHFSTVQKPPYLVYKVTSSNNFIADNKVYKKIRKVDIELYTEIKSTGGKPPYFYLLKNGIITKLFILRKRAKALLTAIS